MVIDKELTVDQSFTGHTNLSCTFNDSSAFVAQTYTAHISGVLVGIKLNIMSRASWNSSTVFEVYPLHVAIRQVQEGYPNSKILGETIIPDGDAPLDRLITFPNPIPQEAGRQYAIVVNYLNAPSVGAYQWLGRWSGATGDQYPDGELFYGPEGETWYASSVKDHDVQFQTYVSPD